ncbi:MAG: biotin/lipoyl-binding protein, partial [Thiobacillus sp.]|nr:biotin/lipoyl-binding protein [Thiobacillus sp.]
MLRALPLVLFAIPAWAADLTAQLEWSQRVAIAIPLTGVVETVNVQPGQRVDKGAALLSLNQTVFKAGLMEARADIERLTQEKADAQRELDRANELYARTVSSTTELDAAKLRHARAAALLAAAEARVEKARRLLD